MGLSEKALSPFWNLPETSLTFPGISLSLKYCENFQNFKKLPINEKEKAKADKLRDDYLQILRASRATAQQTGCPEYVNPCAKEPI